MHFCLRCTEVCSDRWMACTRISLAQGLTSWGGNCSPRPQQRNTAPSSTELCDKQEMGWLWSRLHPAPWPGPPRVSAWKSHITLAGSLWDHGARQAAVLCCKNTQRHLQIPCVAQGIRQWMKKQGKLPSLDSLRNTHVQFPAGSMSELSGSLHAYVLLTNKPQTCVMLNLQQSDQFQQWQELLQVQQSQREA